MGKLYSKDKEEEIKMKITKLTIITVALYAGAIAMGLLNWTVVNLNFNIIAMFFALFSAKKILGNYSNLTVLFLIFHFLYGFSGPIAVMFGDGISSIFTNVYNIDAFFIAFDLSTIGFLLGINMFYTINKRKVILEKEKLDFSNKYFLYAAYGLAIISTILELFNFIRAGGLSTVLMGKAAYQSNIADMSFSIPTQMVLCVAISIFGMYLINNDNKKVFKKVFLFIVFLLPIIILNILLGQRGKLVSYFIIAFLIYTYSRPLKRIKISFVLIFGIVYLFMGFIYANRSIVFLLKDNPEKFFDMAFNTERINRSLNPSSNEFGVGFANFNELYVSENYELLFGKSYLQGLVIAIPSFAYIGEKPQQITYFFRDKYFYSESLRSSIAGTGFSSILEAYWNFGFPGVLIIYLIFGLLLTRLDLYYKYKNNFTLCVYYAIAPFIVGFHRTAFGDVIANIFYKVVMILIIPNGYVHLLEYMILMICFVQKLSHI